MCVCGEEEGGRGKKSKVLLALPVLACDIKHYLYLLSIYQLLQQILKSSSTCCFPNDFIVFFFNIYAPLVGVSADTKLVVHC
jgi:hypothetical protein